MAPGRRRADRTPSWLYGLYGRGFKLVALLKALEMCRDVV